MTLVLLPGVKTMWLLFLEGVPSLQIVTCPPINLRSLNMYIFMIYIHELFFSNAIRCQTIFTIIVFGILVLIHQCFC